MWKKATQLTRESRWTSTSLRPNMSIFSAIQDLNDEDEEEDVKQTKQGIETEDTKSSESIPISSHLEEEEEEVRGGRGEEREAEEEEDMGEDGDTDVTSLSTSLTAFSSSSSSSSSSQHGWSSAMPRKRPNRYSMRQLLNELNKGTVPLAWTPATTFPAMTMEQRSMCLRVLDEKIQEQGSVPDAVDAFCQGLQETYWYWCDNIADPTYQHIQQHNHHGQRAKDLLLFYSECTCIPFVCLKTLEPVLRRWLSTYERRPVAGACILDPSKSNLLVVQHRNSKLLSFPRGKVKEGERVVDAAIREVQEETGIDLTGIQEQDPSFELWKRDQSRSQSKSIRLFVVHSKPEWIQATQQFDTSKNPEIIGLQWFPLQSLQSSSKLFNWESRVFFPMIQEYIQKLDTSSTSSSCR